jgi:hypothetical protein
MYANYFVHLKEPFVNVTFGYTRSGSIGRQKKTTKGKSLGDFCKREKLTLIWQQTGDEREREQEAC